MLKTSFTFKNRSQVVRSAISHHSGHHRPKVRDLRSNQRYKRRQYSDHASSKELSATCSTASDLTQPTSTENHIEIWICTSEKKSYFGPPWKEVWEHISQRLKWANKRFSPHTLSSMDPSLLQNAKVDLALFVGLSESDTNPSFLERIKEMNPKAVLAFDTTSSQVEDLVTLNGFHPSRQGFWEQLQKLFPWYEHKNSEKVYNALQEVWKRQTSDDLVYLIQFTIDQFITELPEMADLEPDFAAIQCVGKNCRNEVIQCLLDPECRKALDCINACGINDQVCSYRCIASYESKLLEKFSLCILQKHNCFKNTASIPLFPEVAPIETFRGELLSFETAEDILIGHLGNLKWSWKIACGKNPAYDYFPCQFQLFYRGKGRGVVWYDPVFKVITLDGREVWRRRHYRVRPASKPGSFFFSVLDNGVTSNEYWRIVDVDEDLKWCLFYYAGAAAAAGISYTGAVLGTMDGKQPQEAEQTVRIERALEKCGIKTWEISKVDYSRCQNPPLEYPQRNKP